MANNYVLHLGSSADSENNTRSRSTRRQRREIKRDSEEDVSGFVYFLKFALISSMFPSQPKQSKGKKSRSKGTQDSSKGVLISIGTYF